MIDLRLGRYQDTLADVSCDLLCVDAPYSARTHGGHDGAPTVVANCVKPCDGSSRPNTTRRAISYDGWTSSDVRDFVDFFAPKTRGWMVSITDHILAPEWDQAMAAHDRYVFAPLPWFAPGSRVRLQGDGPSSWTCWIVVSRPRTGEDRNGRKYSKWGTLPGGYAVTQERSTVVGNKPAALMLSLVRDYSRPGDTVCDPCAGGGTTLQAAHKLGRIAIGSEMDPDTHAAASMRLGLVEDNSGLPLFSQKI